MPEKKPKLVKNTKHVKFPREAKTVESALRKAMHHARQESWDKVIIIGEGKNDARSIYSKMDHYTAIGMLQTEAASCTKDIIDS